MEISTIWRWAGLVVLVYLGGTILIFTTFALAGFPFPAPPGSSVLWVELSLLLLLFVHLLFS